MSNSPVQGGAGAASNATRGARAADPYDVESLIMDPSEVMRDGMMSGEKAEQYWRKFCQQAGLDLNEGKVRMAISCAAGTSAETDYSERLLDADEPKTSVERLVNMLSEERTLAKRVNKLRVFCRSLPGFALLTRRVIIANPWLARDRASEYEVDVKCAGVCFDYSDVLVREDIELAPMELQIIKYGLRQKAGNGRAMAYGGEGYGVPGSAPRDRGVAESIVPDASRVTGRGSGPYGR